MKKLLIILFSFVATWLPQVVQAQTTAEMQTRYQNGQQLLKQQKYELAMAEFLPIVGAEQRLPFQESAMYLYAVAANKAKKNAKAISVLDQLITGAPEWENIEEAYYLLAKAEFEGKGYAKALTALKNCQSDFIKADADNMKRTFLNLLNEKNEFIYLLRDFPEDGMVAKVYADKLMAGWYTEEDKSQLENLVRKFNLNPAQYNGAAVSAGRKKDQYNVAVLFPFATDNISQARKNQFATDLYAGMKLAQDSLAKNRIKINLFAYNSGTDTATTRKTLNLPEMRSMDLIIGPVYKSAAKMASAFAAKHKINLVNPLSEDFEVIKTNPNVFLYESSIETRARKAADFAYDSFEPKTAAIIFENSKNDTTFARAYRSQFISRGGQVLLYKKINTKKNPNVMSVYAGVDLKTFGHLAVSSENLPAAVATISQLESQNPKLPVITHPAWLEMPQLSLQQLDELEIHFVSPKYLDPASALVKDFHRKYLAVNSIPPSLYAYSGFELLYYFGSQLNNYGSQFQTLLPNNGPVTGSFYQGIFYGTARDNQYVPVLKLENRQLEILNPISR